MRQRTIRTGRPSVGLFRIGLGPTFALGAWALVGPSGSSPAQPPRAHPALAEAAATSDRSDARAVYRQRCQRCHDADGSGASSDAPDFRAAAWQKRRTDVQLLVSILDGVSTMPGFRGKLSQGQARDLVALVRSFGGRSASARLGDGAAEDFEARFRQLQEELDELRRQFYELTRTARAP
jgi:mono/diheme cytochrome c family protein